MKKKNVSFPRTLTATIALLRLLNWLNIDSEGNLSIMTKYIGKPIRHLQ